MRDLGLLIAVAALGTIATDRRFRRGTRGNVRMQGWRLYLLCFGLGIFVLGLLFDRRGPIQLAPKLADVTTVEGKLELPPVELAHAPPKRLELAGIALGDDMETLVRRGATCFQDLEADESDSISCTMDAFFGGMEGPLTAYIEDGRIATVFANDNMPEQIAALRSELVATFGSPTTGDGNEGWSIGGAVVDLDTDSVVLYRAR